MYVSEAIPLPNLYSGVRRQNVTLKNYFPLSSFRHFVKWGGDQETRLCPNPCSSLLLMSTVGWSGSVVSSYCYLGKPLECHISLVQWCFLGNEIYQPGGWLFYALGYV